MCPIPSQEASPTFQENSLVSKGNPLLRLMRVASYPSCQREFTLHTGTHVCVLTTNYLQLLWMLQSKATSRSHCGIILSIWAYRLELMYLSFTVKSLHGDVTRPLMPFPLWSKMAEEPVGLSILLLRAGLLFASPICTAQSPGLSLGWCKLPTQLDSSFQSCGETAGA